MSKEHQEHTLQQLHIKQASLKRAYRGGIYSALERVTSPEFYQRLSENREKHPGDRLPEIADVVATVQERLNQAGANHGWIHSAIQEFERVLMKEETGDIDYVDFGLEPNAPHAVSERLDVCSEPGEHLDHYKKGYRKARESINLYLKRIIQDREMNEPIVYKPERILFGYRDEFTETNRQKAEQTGIHYVGRVVDLLSGEDLQEAKEELSFDEDDETFNLTNYYVADLLPITPSHAFLNHDRDIFINGGSSAMVILLNYLDYLGENDSQNPYAFEEDYSLFVDFMKQRMIARKWQRDSTLSRFREKDIQIILGSYRSHLMQLEDSKTLSFPDQDMSSWTYMKTYGTELDLSANGFMRVRFQIDVAKLLKWRNIFADPEQLSMPDEYGKTFVVPGGIPLQAIHRWDFWSENKGIPPMLKEERK